NRRLFLLLVSVMILTYIFFMGFMKFNRRFTLEGFMCLLIDKSYRINTNQEYKNEEITIKNNSIEQEKGLSNSLETIDNYIKDSNQGE
ncbi:MAG: hypothetical protein Q4A76_01675, partial [Porphyromonadaceae bacterium]|nr:hypothetical protein [Porphyromonadaceae bacterium]